MGKRPRFRFTPEAASVGEVTLSREGSGRLVARNTLINAGGRSLNVALAIVLTPFLLQRLGAVDYGIWILATGLTFTAGYLSVAELGFMQAIVRRIAQARSVDDFDAASSTASTSTAAYTGLGLILALVLVGISIFLVDIFSIPEPTRRTAMLVFAIVAFQIAIDLPAASVMSILEGSQRYGAIRAVEATGRCSWFAGTLVTVGAGYGVVAVAVVSLVTAAITLVISFGTARLLEPAVELRPSFIRRSALRQLQMDAPPLLALRVLLVVYSQMDRVVVGVALGAVAVTEYDITFKIHSAASLVLGIAPSAVMPAAAFLGARSAGPQLRALFERGTRYATAAAAVLSTAVFLYADLLIEAWVGNEYAYLAVPTRLFLVYPVVTATIVVGQTILIGLGDMRDILRIQALAVAVNLLVSVVLVQPLGVTGVIVGTLAGAAIAGPLSTAVFLRRFEMPFPQLARAIVPRLAPAVTVQVLAGLAFVPVARSYGLVGAVIGCGTNALVGALAVFVLLPDHERRAVAAAVSARLG